MVNQNIQIVTLWLSSEETTVLDNALITMEHIYRSGIVNIFLNHLARKPSYYEIVYWIDRVENGDECDPQLANNRGKVTKTISLSLSMSDIDNHKRQLTFCNVDFQESLIYKKFLINGQLKLLQKIEDIYYMYAKLESAGHPDFQIYEKHDEIHLVNSKRHSSLKNKTCYSTKLF